MHNFRRSKSGQKSTLSKEQEGEVVQHIKQKNENHEPVTTDAILDFIKEQFGWCPSQSYVSKLAHRHDFADHKTQI